MPHDALTLISVHLRARNTRASCLPCTGVSCIVDPEDALPIAIQTGTGRRNGLCGAFRSILEIEVCHYGNPSDFADHR